MSKQQNLLNSIISEIYSTEKSYRIELEKLKKICDKKLKKITQTKISQIQKELKAKQSYFGLGILSREKDEGQMLAGLQQEYFDRDQNFQLLSELTINLEKLLIPFSELKLMEERILEIKSPNPNPLTFDEIRQFFGNMLIAFSEGGSIATALTSFVYMCANQKSLKNLPDLFFNNQEDPKILQTLGANENNWETFFDNHLIMPIQRMPRYLLLIKELTKHLPEDQYTAQEKHQLLSAVDQMGKTMTKYTPLDRTPVTINLLEREAKRRDSASTNSATKQKKNLSKVDSNSDSPTEVGSTSDSRAETGSTSDSGDKAGSSTTEFNSQVEYSPGVESPSPEDEEEDRRPSFIPISTETLNPVKVSPPPVPFRKPRTGSGVVDTSVNNTENKEQSSSLDPTNKPQKDINVPLVTPDSTPSAQGRRLPPPIPKGMLRKDRGPSIDLTHSQSVLPLTENKETASKPPVINTPPPLPHSNTDLDRVGSVTATRLSFLQSYPATITQEKPKTPISGSNVSVRSTSALFQKAPIMGVRPTLPHAQTKGLSRGNSGGTVT